MSDFDGATIIAAHLRFEPDAKDHWTSEVMGGSWSLWNDGAMWHVEWWPDHFDSDHAQLTMVGDDVEECVMAMARALKPR